MIQTTQNKAIGLIFHQLKLAVKLALRDIRGSIHNYRIFIACLVLGVAAISGVGSISKAMNAGITNDSRNLLGGDLSIQLSHRPISDGALSFLTKNGRVSKINNMRAMARTPNGVRRTLIELKAVDDFYPLFGAVKLSPNIPLAAALDTVDGRMGTVIDPALSQRLNLKLGDQLKIGEAIFTIRAEIINEPDKVVRFTTFGPRTMIHSQNLFKTGLLRKGSLAKFNYRLDLKEGKEIKGFIETLNNSFPSEGWRIRTIKNAVPGFDRFNKQVTQFLTLIGLTALLVGGLGIANTVRNFLDQRTLTISTLKCLGASNRLVFKIYLIQTMALATISIILGVLLGASSPFIASHFISNFMPIDIPQGLYWQPILTAALYGYLMTLVFTIWPLGQTSNISPAQLFRSIITPTKVAPKPLLLIIILTAISLLVSVAIITTEDRRLAISFICGVTLIFLIFGAAGKLVIIASQKLPAIKSLEIRLAVANIHRPGSPASNIVLSLGIGLTLLLTIALIETNLRHQLNEQIPKIAPSYFFIDIQPHQADAYTKIVTSAKGFTKIEKTPMVRGRVVRIKGVSVEKIKPDQNIAWAINGDRGLTYANIKPPKTKLIAGSWWKANYKGPPLISLDANVARGIKVGIGDSITLNVLGREITATIASLRHIEWANLGMNFVFIFSPGTLESAPHSIISAVYANGVKAEENIQRIVTDAFPNISAIGVKDALENANKILQAISIAIRLTASITLLAGILVLAGALGAQQQKRIYDATILKVLGMTRKRLIIAYLAEYAALGLLSALIAIALASTASWLVATKIMQTSFELNVVSIVVITLVSLFVTMTLGLMRTWQSLGLKPSIVLRS